MKKRILTHWAYENVPVYAKWSSILYALRADRVTLKEGLALWEQAKRDFKPGPTGFLDWEHDLPGDFFYLLAKKMHDESEERMCINGNCVEWWYRGRNTGGFGPAGCGCS